MFRDNLASLGSLSALCVSFVLFALVARGTKVYWQNTWRLAIKKRFPNAVLVSNLAIACLFLTFYPFILASLTGIPFLANRQSHLVSVVLFAWYPFSGQAILYATLFRFYLFYYDMNWTSQSRNEKWKSIINPLLYQSDTEHTVDWFLHRRHDYGNGRWIAQRMVCMYLCAAVADSTIHVLGGLSIIGREHTILVDGLVYLVPCGVCVFLWRKTPREHETFQIFKELRRILRVGILMLCIYFLAPLASFSVRRRHRYDFQVAWGVCVGMPGFAALSYVSTYWVLSRSHGGRTSRSHERRVSRVRSGSRRSERNLEVVKSEPPDSDMPPTLRKGSFQGSIQGSVPSTSSAPGGANNTPRRSTRRTFSGAASLRLPALEVIDTASSDRERERTRDMSLLHSVVDSFRARSDPMERDLTLLECLAREQSFEIFIHHLSKEVSMENLLSLVEFAQYRHLLEKDQSFMLSVKMELPDRELTGFDRLKLPVTLPKSFIVYGDMELDVEDVDPAVESARLIQDYQKRHSALLALPTSSPHSARNSGIPRLATCNYRMSASQLSPRQKYKIIAFKLVMRYIRDGAELEINIPHGVRQDIVRRVPPACRGSGVDLKTWVVHADDHQDITNVELYTLFDETFKELQHLLSDAFGRFTATGSYDKLLKLLSYY